MTARHRKHRTRNVSFPDRCRGIALVLHRWVGVGLAGILVMSGLTGSIIAFHEPLDAWLNPSLFQARAAGPRLPFAELEADFAATRPEAKIVYLQFGTPAGEAVRAFVAAKNPAQKLAYNQVFLDPASGAVLGQREYGSCCLARAKLMPFLYVLHYSLMAGLPGTWIMGVIGLVWFFDCLVAITLTFPRGRPGFWRRWRKAWAVKNGGRGFRLVFDLHRAGGLWLWGLLSIISFSGFAINLDRPVFRPALGVFLPLSPNPFLKQVPAGGRFDPDAIVKAATQAIRPRWKGRASGLYCPGDAGPCAVYFAPSPATEGAGLGSPIVFTDRAGEHILKLQWPDGGAAGDIIERLQFPLHSGQIAGLAGKIVICLSGIATALLAATGLIIFARKRLARRQTLRGGMTRKNISISPP